MLMRYLVLSLVPTNDLLCKNEKSYIKDDVTYFCIFSRPLEKTQNGPDFPTLPLAFRSEMTGFYLKIKNPLL